MEMTLKQIATAELRAATDAYCNASKNISAQAVWNATVCDENTAFSAASLRLHIARGGPVSRASVRASRVAIKAATEN